MTFEDYFRILGILFLIIFFGWMCIDYYKIEKQFKLDKEEQIKNRNSPNHWLYGEISTKEFINRTSTDDSDYVPFIISDEEREYAKNINNKKKNKTTTPISKPKKKKKVILTDETKELFIL